VQQIAELWDTLAALKASVGPTAVTENDPNDGAPEGEAQQ
jgi:hypothetical protein